MSTIARWLANNARFYGDEVGVAFNSETFTWRDVAGRAGGLAAGLAERGLAVGDRVALVTDNVPEMLEAYYAAASCGVIVAPVSTRLHAEELNRYFGEYLKPQAAIVGPGSEPCLGRWIDDCSLVVEVRGGPGVGVAYDEVLLAGAELDLGRDPRATYTIGQTSGTTGFPRGAEISQAAAASAIKIFLAELATQTDDAYLIQHPMSNVPGGPGQLFPLPKGARTVVVETFEPEQCLRTIEAQRVTHTVLVPAMLRAVLDFPRRGEFDTSSLKAVIVGASPIPKPLLEEAVGGFRRGVPTYVRHDRVAVGGLCAALKRHVPSRVTAARSPRVGRKAQCRGRPAGGRRARLRGRRRR